MFLPFFQTGQDLLAFFPLPAYIIGLCVKIDKEVWPRKICWG